MKECTILVLMSTFNGEKYIKTQIDSILAQKGVQVQLLVRDDGSSDSTVHILETYAAQHKLTYYTGPNLGPAKSFLDLLKQAPEADYYAFSDQDDYWLPNKLEQAITKLQELHAPQLPCLYYAHACFVDADLKPLPREYGTTGHTSFKQAVIYNGAVGCTFVFNRQLVNLARCYIPQYLIMHDAWLHTLCLAVGGKVYFDSGFYIYYRQHENNFCAGACKSFPQRLTGYWKSWFFVPNVRYNMLQQIFEGYSTQILPQNREILQKILNYKKGWKYKWALLRDKSIRSGNKKVDYKYMLNVLLGRF